jgi:hypothetical protein
VAKTRNQLGRIYSLRCLTKLQAGACWTGSYPSFTILLAPVKHLVGVDCMPTRYTCYRRPGFQRLFDDSSLLFDRPLPSRYLLGCLIKDGLLGCVQLFLVDTYRCARIGQHPYLLSLRPDGSHQSLTKIVHTTYRKANPSSIWYPLMEAQIVIEKWRANYNTKRPHSAGSATGRLPRGL